MRKLRLLAAMLAVVAAMVASSVSPATAAHWDLYHDEWGMCGWNWTPIWPYWEYDCHHYFGPVWDPPGVGFDSRDVDRLDRHRWDVDRGDCEFIGWDGDDAIYLCERDRGDNWSSLGSNLWDPDWDEDDD